MGENTMWDMLQWPAMLSSLAAAWLVASSAERRRAVGFWVFLLSNVLWVAWGVYTAGWALVVLQLGLAAMNLRGLRKNDADAPSS
ncbi:amino acid transporter [Pseudorhodoferax sp. Leaf274]|nr:amino acid transporter [Pseudorhodoferax sp. Leaf274]